jgi:hypothetical protein
MSFGDKLERARERLESHAADIEYPQHFKSNAQMVCPHCLTKGSVQTRRVRAKAGVSGGKATGALLTGGLSLLATGLSKKTAVTQAKCLSCNNRWEF